VTAGRRIALVLAVCLGVGSALLLWHPADEPAKEPPAASAPPAPARPVADAWAVAPAPVRAEPAAFQAWLQQSSSLRGAELDGDWGLDSRGQLHPQLSLRLRFDQLLTLLGEVSLEDLGRYIDFAVTERAGAHAARQVLEVWQRYVQLHSQSFKQPVNPRDWRTWQAALDEQHQARQALLGAAWANAFYREEEEALTVQIRQAQAAETAPQGTAVTQRESLIQRETLTTQQAQRLSQAEAEWDQWKRRVAEAQRTVARIQQAPELSAPQRVQAADRWLAENFDANEQRRVRALIEAGEALP